MNTVTESPLTPIYDEPKLSHIESLERMAIEAAIVGDEATVKAAGQMLAEALGDIPRNFRPCPAVNMKPLSRDPKSLVRWASHRAIWFQGQPLGIGDHNLFILLALPELSRDEDVQLEHSAYDTDWKLPGGALQWDRPYSGWIAVNV